MSDKDFVVEHSERIAKTEAKLEAIDGRLDDLSMSVAGLASQVNKLATTLEKYKWFMLAIVILLGMDNELVKLIIKKFIGG